MNIFEEMKDRGVTLIDKSELVNYLNILDKLGVQVVTSEVSPELSRSNSTLDSSSDLYEYVETTQDSTSTTEETVLLFSTDTLGSTHRTLNYIKKLRNENKIILIYVSNDSDKIIVENFLNLTTSYS